MFLHHCQSTCGVKGNALMHVLTHYWTSSSLNGATFFFSPGGMWLIGCFPFSLRTQYISSLWNKPIWHLQFLRFLVSNLCLKPHTAWRPWRPGTTRYSPQRPVIQARPMERPVTVQSETDEYSDGSCYRFRNMKMSSTRPRPSKSSTNSSSATCQRSVLPILVWSRWSPYSASKTNRLKHSECQISSLDNLTASYCNGARHQDMRKS